MNVCNVGTTLAAPSAAMWPMRHRLPHAAPIAALPRYCCPAITGQTATCLRTAGLCLFVQDMQYILNLACETALEGCIRLRSRPDC